MRVFLTHRPGGAYAYVSDGWCNALLSAGATVNRWDGQQASWDAFQPELYIGCSGHRQPLPPPARRRGCRVAIHVNPYGPVDLGGINESRSAIDWTIEQSPDAVFGYGHEADKRLWQHWTTKAGIQWVPLPTAGDLVAYPISGPSLSASYDLVYIGGRWDYKARTIDKFLMPVLSCGLTYRLHGWGGWPSQFGCTTIEDGDVATAYRSAKVAPCVAEEHTEKTGIDLPERCFKAALCGTLVVHEKVMGLYRYLPSAVVADDPGAYLDNCRYFADQARDTERVAIVARQAREVIHSHTYHDRMALLLRWLGFAAMADALMATKCSLAGSYSEVAQAEQRRSEPAPR